MSDTTKATSTTTGPIQDRVLQLLRERGWTTRAGRPDFVAKEYQTYVGVKVASAWCTYYEGEGQSQFWLHGHYLSEGRDALASCCGFFNAGAAEAVIVAAVDKFARDADNAVADTYAMRLMRPSEGRDESRGLIERLRG